MFLNQTNTPFNQTFEKEAYIRDAISSMLTNYDQSLKKKREIPNFTGGIWDCDMVSSEECDVLETPANEPEEIPYKHLEENERSLTQLFTYEEYLDSNEDTLDNDSAENERNEISQSPIIARKRNLSSESSSGTEATCVLSAMDCASEISSSFVNGLATSDFNSVPAVNSFFVRQDKHVSDYIDSNKLDEKLINSKEGNKRFKLQPSETTLFPNVADKATAEKGKPAQSFYSSYVTFDRNSTQIKNGIAESGAVEDTNDTSFVTASEEILFDMPVVKVEYVAAYKEEIEDLKRVTALFVSFNDQPEKTKSSFTAEIESLKRICSILEDFETHAISHIQADDVLQKLEAKNKKEVKMVDVKDCSETVSTSVSVGDGTCITSHNFNAAMPEGLLNSKDECSDVKDSNIDMAITDQQILEDKQMMEGKIMKMEDKQMQMVENKEIGIYSKKVSTTQLQEKARAEKTLNLRKNSAFEKINTVPKFRARNIPPRMLNKFQYTTTDSSPQSKTAFREMNYNFDYAPLSNGHYKYTNNYSKQANRSFTSNRFQERKEPSHQRISPDINRKKPQQVWENRHPPDLPGWRSPIHVPEWRNKSMPQKIDNFANLSNSAKFENCSDDVMNLKVFEMGGQRIDELFIPYDTVVQIRKQFSRFSELVPNPDMTAKRLEWSAQSMVVILRSIFSISYTLPSWEIGLEIYAIANKYRFVKLQKSCESYFNDQPITIAEAQKIFQLANYLKVVDVLGRSKNFAKLNFVHEAAVPFSFSPQSCSVVCAIYAEPSDFTIPLVSQKKSGIKYDLGSTKQCDLTNELIMETNSDICIITGIQIKLEADICDIGKELQIFYDVFLNEKKIFGNDREMKLQKMMIINFKERLVLKRKEKMKILILIEDICLRLCYLTLKDEVKNDDVRLTLMSDKKSTHESNPLFFVEKVFYTVQGNA